MRSARPPTRRQLRGLARVTRRWVRPSAEAHARAVATNSLPSDAPTAKSPSALVATLLTTALSKRTSKLSEALVHTAPSVVVSRLAAVKPSTDALLTSTVTRCPAAQRAPTKQLPALTGSGSNNTGSPVDPSSRATAPHLARRGRIASPRPGREAHRLTAPGGGWAGREARSRCPRSPPPGAVTGHRPQSLLDRCRCGSCVLRITTSLGCHGTKRRGGRQPATARPPSR